MLPYMWLCANLTLQTRGLFKLTLYLCETTDITLSHEIRQTIYNLFEDVETVNNWMDTCLSILKR